MISESQGRLQDRRPLSIIDIGSNSIRLVIYEGIARSPTILFNEKMLAGLGRGIVSTGRLDPEAVTRSIAEFRRFRSLSELAGAERLCVIATAAAREAENGPDFIARSEEVLGMRAEARVVVRDLSTLAAPMQRIRPACQQSGQVPLEAQPFREFERGVA